MNLNNIKHYRLMCGWTQEDLAYALATYKYKHKISVSCTKQAISQWETCGALPLIETAIALTRIFSTKLKKKITIEDLIISDH